jgi:hypothetical protein
MMKEKEINGDLPEIPKEDSLFNKIKNNDKEGIDKWKEKANNGEIMRIV